jgi:hypothetical protein
MADAVAEYARHRLAPDNWALGRFVVPLARWTELEAAAPQEPWPVSVLAAPSDAPRIREIIDGTDYGLEIEAVECKAASPAEALSALDLVQIGTDVYVEFAPSGDLSAMTTALRRAGAAAKIRTGGVTPDSFPAARDVLSFLRACRGARIRFKATAGLHHAVRGEYRLTYEPAAPVGTMYGFLNIAMAAAFHWFDRDDDTVLAVLEERSADAFEFTDAGGSWRNKRLTRDQLYEVRREFFVGFGSCSFSEPMAEVGLQAVPRT